MVHLGDQLEGVNTPRARAAEAQMLMKYFAEFMENGPLKSEIFVDPFQVVDNYWYFILFLLLSLNN